MDDLNDIRPGKLKRKPKRLQSTSFVDMPAVSSRSSRPGGLLGDKLMSSDEGGPSSLLDLVIESQNLNAGAKSYNEIPKQLLDSEVEAANLTSSIPSGPSPLEALAKSDNDDESLEPMPSEARPSIQRKPKALKASIRSSNKSIEPVALSSLGNEIVERSAYHTPLQAGDDMSQAEQGQLSIRLEQSLGRLESASTKSTEYLSQFQKIQARAEHRHILNYIAAYIIFCITCAIIIYFALQYKNSAKQQQLLYKNEVYQSALNAKKILENEFERDQRGSSSAFEVFQLSEEGRYDEAIERFTAVRGELTHPAEAALLEQRIDTIRWRLADNAYHEGVSLYTAGNLEQARDAFYKSQAHKENTAYTPMLSFYLAQSLFQLGDFEGARRYYEKAQTGELSAEMDATALFNRATAAEKVGDEADAYLQYDAFLKRYRYHRLSDEANKRRAKLERAKPSS